MQKDNIKDVENEIEQGFGLDLIHYDELERTMTVYTPFKAQCPLLLNSFLVKSYSMADIGSASLADLERCVQLHFVPPKTKDLRGKEKLREDRQD